MADLYLVIRTDAPDSLDARKAAVAAHMTYSEDNEHRFMIGGGLRAGCATDPALGSAMIVKGDSVEEVRAFCDEDPFARAGVFARTDIYFFRPGIGEWIGGKIW
jgi:uncharacterized protein YciI